VWKKRSRPTKILGPEEKRRNKSNLRELLWSSRKKKGTQGSDQIKKRRGPRGKGLAE